MITVSLEGNAEEGCLPQGRMLTVSLEGNAEEVSAVVQGVFLEGFAEVRLPQGSVFNQFPSKGHADLSWCRVVILFPSRVMPRWAVCLGAGR